MKYLDFYNLLFKYRLITPIWKYELELINNEFNCNDECLNLFSIYFSLIDFGNVCMSLNSEILMNKWEELVLNQKVLFIDDDSFDFEEYDTILNVSKDLINNHLDKIQKLKLNEFFTIDDNYLYIRKYNEARLGIINSLGRIYSLTFNNQKVFQLNECVDEKFSLSKGQQESLDKGLNNNLVITGGPGTGKTTSILFILLYLLANDINYNIYLAASSGKASSRMKESIMSGLKNLSGSFKEKYKDIIDKISGVIDTDTVVSEFTIHRLLGVRGSGFLYNRYNQFSQNSIFIIDEASMIDICLFNSLLEAIPTGARIFILGDKDQLPSVEVGSVFSDFIKSKRLKNNVVALDQSKRFSSDTYIYDLAYRVNNGIDLGNIIFSNPMDFKIEELDRKKCPIFYYQNNNIKKEISNILNIWTNTFFTKLVVEAKQISLDKTTLDKLFSNVEESKILCAENKGNLGVLDINLYVKKKMYKSIYSNYPGQIMMINKNNKALDLYNGDTGILVTISNDDTLYLMVQKETRLCSNDLYKKDEIFKMGSFVFYPFRMLKEDEIDLAFAISIHKSQGSDYKNILVMLPNKKGHPLLNRQILYTAITRTKGNTYIFATRESLDEAKDRIITRDTNVY